MKYLIDNNKRKVVLGEGEDKVTFWGVKENDVVQYPTDRMDGMKETLKSIGFVGAGRPDPDVMIKLADYLDRL